ncbi:MAG TPA: ACT domain-containing protein [Kiritimatiellia bacterium]|nr:ACT domain-containing protein [Kiritimatiellia bacterium]HRU71157.1 ACT domain-containing protein [Kiritimatiellia bacterium]
MKINQISLFLENKPGHLNAICRTLAEAQINIVTLSLADTQQFGIVRLIVEEWQKAKAVLEQAGYVVNVREVVAAAVPDKPGGMAEILDVVGRAGVNIEYMYAFAFRHGAEAVLVFRFDNPDRAIEALKKAGHDVLDAVTLFTEAK